MKNKINKLFTIENQCFCGFIILVLIFIAAKWEALFLPFFWDEAWSYMPAVDAMSNAKPCMIPNCIDSELYRGHPLFFYFLASFWAKMIGKGCFSYHAFALIISVFTLISFYKIALKLFNPQLALACCALLMCQEIFIVQSSFVLPEILIMGLTICMYHAYMSKQKWSYIMWGTLLCLTKESGIAITLCFVLSAIMSNYSVKNIRNLAAQWWLLCPFLGIALFLTYQKMVLGWYFFPLHAGMIESTIAPVFHKLKMIWVFLFFEQGRQFISWILSVSIVFILAKKSIVSSKYQTLAFICCLFIVEIATYFYFKNQQFYTCLCFLFLITMFLRMSKIEVVMKQLLTFSTVLFVIYTIFTALNFYMIRYLLVLFPFLILLFTLLFNKLSVFNKAPFALLLMVSLGLNFGLIYKKDVNKEWIDDVHLNYMNMVKVHQEAVEYCETNDWYDQKIYTHFLMDFNLKLPFLHYLTRPKKFDFIHTEGPLQVGDIIVISSVEYNESLHQEVATSKVYHLSKRFQRGSAWCEIYQKND
jgi:4-amino-4-deoxy-L-arabinose transferase-like glycosyltransferase